MRQSQVFGKYLLLDFSGKELGAFDHIYDRVAEGKLLVKEGRSEWFVDANGTKIMDYTKFFAYYGTITPPFFSEDIVPITQNKLKGYIRIRGEHIEVVAAPQFKTLYPFRDGHAVVQHATGKYGMIDKRGETLIPFKYKYCSYSDQAGYAIVTTDDDKQMFVKLPEE